MITHVTETNFEQEVEKHPGKVLIDFYTPTCPPCRMFAPILDEIATEQAGKLKVVKVDASHVAMISQPEKVAAAIIAAAEKSKQ